MSGDQYGAAVARELHRRRPDLTLIGFGGAEMAAAGVELVAELDRLAVMGRVEVLKRLPYFLDLERRVTRVFEDRDVRLFLPIDYPGLNLRLCRAAREQARRVLYFVSPQVWAWKERRAHKLRTDCDRVLHILPFEHDVLERYGVDHAFVGHPLLDMKPAEATTRAAPSNVIALFPGSRAQEVRAMLPVFLEAAQRLSDRGHAYEFVVAGAPQLAEELYRDSPHPVIPAPEAIAAAHAAIAKSGTVTLQLALAGVPMVVGYKTTRLEYALGRRLVKVPSIVLVNLIAEAPVVPELLQDALTAETIADALEPLLGDASPARGAMLDAFEEVRGRLGGPGCIDRVVDHAMGLLS